MWTVNQNRVWTSNKSVFECLNHFQVDHQSQSIILAMSSVRVNQMPSPNASPSPSYIQSQNEALLSQANNSLIPQRSEKTYRKWFNQYDNFCKSRHLNFNQDSLLMYLEHFVHIEEAGHKSMYSYASGIKSILSNVKGIKTANWSRVKGWLKRYAEGKVATKAPTFTNQEIARFRKKAPVIKFRRHKIAEGFGTYGRLRAEDYAILNHNKSSEVGKEEKIDVYESYVYVFLYLCSLVCFFYMI